MEKVDEFKETVGKPLKFSDISDELDKIYAHILGQKNVIKESIDNFKNNVFKIAVSRRVLSMIGE